MSGSRCWSRFYRPVVCVGEVTSVWDRIGPIINKVVIERTPLVNAVQIIGLNEYAYPRLRGAISLVLQKHFVAPSVA